MGMDEPRCGNVSENVWGVFHTFSEAEVRGKSPWAMTAIGVFLVLGAIMASLAGTTLISGVSSMD
jgi:hypothetical protein